MNMFVCGCVHLCAFCALSICVAQALANERVVTVEARAVAAEARAESAEGLVRAVTVRAEAAEREQVGDLPVLLPLAAFGPSRMWLHCCS